MQTNARISFVLLVPSILWFISNGICNSKKFHSTPQGEKLLNNLGGMFSKPWKPKKTREITGPVITPGLFLLAFMLMTSHLVIFHAPHIQL